MKKMMIFIAVSMFLYSCTSSTNEQQEQISEEPEQEVVVESDVNSFGEEITEEGAVTTENFLEQMGDKVSMDVKIKGNINAVCQKKGCWMNIDLGNGEEMKIRFKDYEFFVPKDAAGKTAIFEGFAYRDTLTVEMLQHYAEDAGEPEDSINAITEPEIVLSFEAFGVIIKDEE